MKIEFCVMPAVSFAAALGSFSVAASSLSFSASSPVVGSTTSEEGYPYLNGTYAAFDDPEDMALGHGATVSGTLIGHPIIHNPANVTDGNYGNGRSWIGTGPDSWLTIDLGRTETFDTLLFGRDRLGNFADRNPGQFTISISDNDTLFKLIFDSAQFGFSGALGVAQTVQASFDKVSAQYVRLQLSEAGAAVDEVEIKLADVPGPAAIWLFGSGLLGLLGIGKKSTMLPLAVRSRLRS